MNLASLAAGGDWPEFLGPERSGCTDEKGIARTWAEGGPKVLWTLDVADGFAGAAIRGGEVYLLDRPDERQDVLRCLDLASGKELWTFAYPAPGKLPYGGSRNTPTVEERQIYTVGPLGNVYCIDRGTHQAIWSHHLVEDFKDAEVDRDEPPKNRAEKLARAQVPEWGVTQSPLVYKGMVILAPQTQKVGVVAYDKLTGVIRWKSPYIGRNWFSHVTPRLVNLGGMDQIVMLAQPSDPEKSPAKAPPANVIGLDPQTGAILWQTQTPRPLKIPIPLPVQIAQDQLFMTGGYALGSLILKVEKGEGGWRAEFIKRTDAAASHIHTPLLHDGRLYVQSHKEHGSPNTGLVCLDLAGELKWKTGPELVFDFGNAIVVDGLILAMNGKTGELSMIEPLDDSYRVLAKAQVLDAEGGMAWGPMAFADGKLVLRDLRRVKCLDLRENMK